MKTILTKTIMTGSAALAILVSPTIGQSQSQSLTDASFEPKSDVLQAAPANVAVIRPTHFSEVPAKIKHIHKDDVLVRTVGQNVSFRDLIAEAYDCSPGRVVLPGDAPHGSFDFLVTYAPKTRKHLRQAIEQELGYTATSESTNTEVQFLQVQDPSLPGLTLNNQGDSDIIYRDGTLYFTHEPLSLVVKGLEDGLGRPVIDRTSLTNCYDFSVAWSAKTTAAMRDGTFHIEGVQKVLNSWGLELKPGHANIKMFTVKKIR